MRIVENQVHAFGHLLMSQFPEDSQSLMIWSIER